MSASPRRWIYALHAESPSTRDIAHHRLARAAAVAAVAIIVLPILAGSSFAANFGAHAGLAEDTVPDPYFVAGALLADLDHFLPPTEPQTDSEAFASGVVERAWEGSHHAWSLSRACIENIDHDTRLASAEAATQAPYHSYTDPAVRLTFSY